MNNKIKPNGGAIVGLVTLALASALQAQVSIDKPVMVLNLNRSPNLRAGAGPDQMFEVNGSLVLTVRTADNDLELWTSDGTSSATRVLTRFGVGQVLENWRSPSPGSRERMFTIKSGEATQYWRTDGTPAGTRPFLEHGPVLQDQTFIDSQGYFFAEIGSSGTELWKTDGTAPGTVRLKDLAPGSETSYVNTRLNVNGTLYFALYAGARGLWKSDGTETGTVRINELEPRGELFAFKGQVLFATLGPAGDERALWITDGTRTVQLKTFASVAIERVRGPIRFWRLHDMLFFQAPASSTRIGLWRTDGTPTGTVLVHSFIPDTNGEIGITFPVMVLNDAFFFSANDGNGGWELWKSDGTPAGTSRLIDVNPGPDSSYPGMVGIFDGNLYFSAADASSGNELWKTDGTTSGTVQVMDLNPGPGGSYPFLFFSRDDLFLVMALNPDGDYDLWRIERSKPGPLRLTTLRSPPEGLFLSQGQATMRGLSFWVNGTAGRELWASEGTEAGTLRIKEVAPFNSQDFSLDHFAQVQDTMFFSVLNSIGRWELWKTDGTASGTVRVRGGDRLPDNGSGPSDFLVVDQSLFFTAYEGPSVPSLWRTDGTSVGTMRLAEFDGVLDGASSPRLVPANGWVFFSGRDESSGSELWKTDGTAVNTLRVADVNPGPGDSSPSSLIDFNGTLFFAADDGRSGRELWKSGGTAGSTVRVKDLQPGPLGSNPYGFVKAAGTLFFFAAETTNTLSLWKSDGTEAGTVPVKSSGPETPVPRPGTLVSANGLVFFVAQTVSSGWELWRSDGTDAGTFEVKDINPGSLDGNPFELTMVNPSLFFTAYDEITGVALWKTDGTAAGTRRVWNSPPEIGSLDPTHLVNVRGTLYFMIRGSEDLWKSDGTEAGTVLVTQIAGLGARRFGQTLGRLLDANGTLYISVFLSYDSSELWRSDGSVAGTTRVPIPSALAPDAFRFAKIGETLFFTTDDAAHGAELWKLYDHDADGDGLPDWWENEFFSGAARAEDDPDGDGMTNWQESRAGTDPRDAASSLRFTRIGARSDGTVRLEWRSAPNQEYVLLRTVNVFDKMCTGTVVERRIVATPPVNLYLDGTTRGPEPSFYRLKLEE